MYHTDKIKMGLEVRGGFFEKNNNKKNNSKWRTYYPVKCI